MQINNNVQSPNFGMALKIKCTPDDLAKAGSDVLDKLGKAGEELANTRYWDLEVLKGELGLQYRVNGKRCANAYTGGIRPAETPRDEFLIIKSTWDGRNEIGGYKKGDACQTIMKLENKEAAVKAYQALKDNPFGIDNAVEATKVLEQWSTFLHAKETAKKDAEMKALAQASNLFEKYGSIEI